MYNHHHFLILESSLPQKTLCPLAIIPNLFLPFFSIPSHHHLCVIPSVLHIKFPCIFGLLSISFCHSPCVDFSNSLPKSHCLNYYSFIEDLRTWYKLLHSNFLGDSVFLRFLSFLLHFRISLPIA